MLFWQFLGGHPALKCRKSFKTWRHYSLVPGRSPLDVWQSGGGGCQDIPTITAAGELLVSSYLSGHTAPHLDDVGTRSRQCVLPLHMAQEQPGTWRRDSPDWLKHYNPQTQQISKTSEIPQTTSCSSQTFPNLPFFEHHQSSCSLARLRHEASLHIHPVFVLVKVGTSLFLQLSGTHKNKGSHTEMCFKPIHRK